MAEDFFFTGRETELRALINRDDRGVLQHAACRGIRNDEYFPDIGEPSAEVLARCTGCPARFACLALALQTETADDRHGWFGGLGPAERDRVAQNLGLPTAAPPAPDPRQDAAQLRQEGLTVDEIAQRLGCCRRTVQRYCSLAG